MKFEDLTRKLGMENRYLKDSRGREHTKKHGWFPRRTRKKVGLELCNFVKEIPGFGKDLVRVAAVCLIVGLPVWYVTLAHYLTQQERYRPNVVGVDPVTGRAGTDCGDAFVYDPKLSEEHNLNMYAREK